MDAADFQKVEEGTLLWTPGEKFISDSRLRRFVSWLSDKRDLKFGDYDALWRWSTDHLEDFWLALFEYMQVIHSGKTENVLDSRKMPARGWFKGVTLNYAENLFRKRSSSYPAMIAISESGERREVSWEDMERRVGALAAHLRSIGISKGDRVAGYVQNIPEAAIAFLATASIGAVWSGCSPDLGSRSVVDRFAQIEPRVLVAVDGYRYGGKQFDRKAVVEEVVSSIKSIEQVILISSRKKPVSGKTVRWEDCTSGTAQLVFERVPFEHPLWILYSSGTTGQPKPIVHGHGGILLEHLKLLSLHSDTKEGDRFFWFTTTSWMMWNVLVSAMLVGATSIMYDGSAAYPDINVLWKTAEDTGMNIFGTSASFINACMKAGTVPRDQFDLSSLRSVSYTGSPLSPAGFKWIYDKVGKDMWVTGVSGGTDVCTAFLCGSPLLPVRAGELQCRALGASIEAFSEDGKELVNEVGELVLTAPLPSMPIYFWNDPGDSRYLDSYYSMYPGIWRHGDWVKITEHGGAVIYGRSDSTLKRHGVRIGTSEIYRCVEGLSEISDSLVIGVERKDGDYYLPLFVVTRERTVLNDELRAKIKQRIREELSPRHVPDEIIEIDEVPRTLNGKKLEVPIKRILSGHPVDEVVNIGSVSNPNALRFFVELSKKRS